MDKTAFDVCVVVLFVIAAVFLYALTKGDNDKPCS